MIGAQYKMAISSAELQCEAGRRLTARQARWSQLKMSDTKASSSSGCSQTITARPFASYNSSVPTCCIAKLSRATYRLVYRIGHDLCVRIDMNKISCCR